MDQQRVDLQWMHQAIELSKQCPPSELFNVGSIVLSESRGLVATGYSRECEGGMHAEEIALAKAKKAAASAKMGTLYSTLEPCHPRKSGKKSCTQHIIDAQIKRVVYALKEQVFFVDCIGAATLAAHGIEVVHLALLEDLVRQMNWHIFDALPKGI